MAGKRGVEKYAYTRTADNEWPELANAIILQAVEDYRSAWRGIWRYKAVSRKRWYLLSRLDLLKGPDLKRFEAWKGQSNKRRVSKYGPYAKEPTEQQRLKMWQYSIESTYKKNKAMVEECRKFFRGDWFRVLTEIDGKELELTLYRMLLAERVKDG